MEVAQCLVNSLVGEGLACGGSWKVVVARQLNLSALTTGRLLRYLATPLVVAVIAVVLFPTSLSSNTTTSVAGVSSQGPSGTVTDTNMTGNHWLQLDEQLGAGQRLVLSGAFLADLAEDLTSSPVGPIWIGLPSSTWSNAAIASVSDTSMWLGGVHIALTHSAWMDNPYGLFVRKGTASGMPPSRALMSCRLSVVRSSNWMPGVRIGISRREPADDDPAVDDFDAWGAGRRRQAIRLRHYERRREDLLQTLWRKPRLRKR